jgi:MFS family permease
MTRTERTYYVVLGGYTVAQWFIAPVYPLFLLSRGLDLFQINAVLATYLVTVFLFDVPTGALADRVGRKASFLLACIVRMVAYGLYAFTRNFTDCVGAEFLDAIGTTLASGALEAWAVDGVRADGDLRPADRLFARGQVVVHSVMIVAGVACGYVAEIGWTAPWFTSAALFAITGVVAAVSMHEAPRARPAGSSSSLGQTAVAGLAAVRAAPVLLLLCLLTLVAAFASFPFFMTWQARVEALAGAGLWRIGWIMGLLNVAALVGSALGPRLLRRFERETLLCATVAWRAMMLALAAGATSVSPMLAGVLLQNVPSGFSDSLMAAWTNEHVAPRLRATVLSVRSTFFTLGGALGLVSLGLVARRLGIPAAWAVSAALFALLAPGYLVLGRVARRVAEGQAVVELVRVPPGKVLPPAAG